MKKIIVIIWQFLTYFLVGIPLGLIFRVKPNVNFQLQKNKSYIISSNHPKKIDPFLISYSIPLKYFIRLIPLRFITAEKYMKNIFLRPFLLLYGCISTKQEDGKSVLEKSKALLNKGETIFIFPSGKLEQENKRYKAKVGANYLEREVKNSLILPVKIDYSNPNVNIEFKEAFRHSSFPEDLQPLADETYKTILNQNLSTTDNLYELKWTIDNNPNGWIEPTTFCQFKCPGCYRGLAEKNHKSKHEALQNLKKQVDWFIDNRNVQSISLAGGEPLLYPYIDELIRYISERKLKTKIYTNGIKLNEKRLKDLKKCGATEFIIHVDKYQRKSKSEKEMNKIRQRYCELFRKVGEVNLGFIMPLSKKNISDLPILADFYQTNSDIINLVVFTTIKEMLPNKTLDKSLTLTMQEASSAVKDAFGLSYCAYLGKSKFNGVSWLFSLSTYKKGRFLGSFDDKFYKSIQERYYKKKHKHFITINNKPIKMSKLLSGFTNKSVRTIIKNSKKYNGDYINSQVVLLIDAPDKIKDSWDICNSCPDAMIYNNKLVPSCLLERVKSGEKIYLN